MPTVILQKDNMTASVNTGNLLAGNIFEFIPYDAHISVYGCTSAAGNNLNIKVDQDTAVERAPIIHTGTTVTIPDYLLWEDDIAGNSRLNLSVDADATGTTDAYFVIVIDPN